VKRSGLGATAGLGALYMLAAARFCWPAGPAGALLGQPSTDLWNSLWGAHHLWQRLLAGPDPSGPAALNFPTGGSVWVADPLGALFVGALAGPLGDSAAWSTHCTVQLGLAGWAAHAFAAERLQAAATPHAGLRAAIAGMSYMACGTLLSAIHNGASEGLCGALPAFAAWMGWRSRQAEAVGAAARAAPLLQAAAIVGATLTSPYAGALAIGLSLGMAILPIGGRSIGGAARRWAGLALGVAVAAPMGWALAERAADPAGLLGIKNGPVLDMTRRSVGPADPRAYLMPGDFRAPDLRRLGRFGERYLHSPYLGASTLLAALAAQRGPPRLGLWTLGIGAFIASLGPVLLLDGAPWIFGDDRVLPLPYLAVEGLPGFDRLTLLWRLGLGLSLALALLASQVARLGRPGLIALLLLILIEPHALSPAGRDQPWVEPTPPSALAALRRSPAGAAAVYPLRPGLPALADQHQHGHPLAVGLNFPSNPTADKLWAALRRAKGGEPAAQRAAVEAEARKLGLRYILIYDDQDAAPDEHTALARRAEALFPSLPGAEGPQLRVLRLW
jgi:hypothetical protein